ncbi:hypothetical protein [Salinivibrio costicola]|uniref:hypothetical protein n=1 Tax=Salinivibrio costicola TaxID=51367 RepID=UPI000472B94C|nr:hypothetical protein [Salinivibrio costicola]
MGKSTDDTPEAKQQAQAEQQADKTKDAAVKAGVTKEGDNVTNSAITNSAINNAAYNTYNKREQADQRVYNNTYNKREHNNNVNNSTVNNTLPDGSSSYNQRAQAAKAQQALPTPETTQNAYAARAQAMQKVQVQNQANVAINLDGEQIAATVVESEQFNEGTQRAMRNAALPNY